MTQRWQQMVMIITSSLIIALKSCEHLQKQTKLRERALDISFPDEIPDGFLWPKEIKDFQNQLRSWEEERLIRENLRVRAKKYGVVLEENKSITDWEEQIEREGVYKSLDASIDAHLRSLSIARTFAPISREADRKLWNLALTGLEYRNIDDVDVMVYELTNATAWFLGYSVSNEELSCPFCAISLSFADAIEIANKLSLAMNIEPCYQQLEERADCDGWHLPNREEWERARGDIGQRWLFLNADQKDPLRATKQVGEAGPNQFGLFDIVGNLSEWLSNKENVGQKSNGSHQDTIPVGVRFYRRQSMPKEEQR